MLIGGYDVLILDEPSSNLDPATSKIVFDYILGVTDEICIVITHEPSKELLVRFFYLVEMKDLKAE